MALGARLGDLGCIGGVWEGESARQIVRLTVNGSAAGWARAQRSVSTPEERQVGWGVRTGDPLEGLGEAFAGAVRPTWLGLLTFTASGEGRNDLVGVGRPR